MNALDKILGLIRKTAQDEKGQALVEYALILAIIGVALALTLPGVTAAINTTYNDIIAAL